MKCTTTPSVRRDIIASVEAFFFSPMFVQYTFQIWCSVSSWLKKKQTNKKKKAQEEPQTEVAANPRHQEEEKKRHKPTTA